MNILGILTDVKSVSIIMHRANGLVFFDYATAAPYVKVSNKPLIFETYPMLLHLQNMSQKLVTTTFNEFQKFMASM